MNVPCIEFDINNLASQIEIRGSQIEYEVRRYMPWVCFQTFLCRVENMLGRGEIIFADGSAHRLKIGHDRVSVSICINGQKAKINDEDEIKFGKVEMALSNALNLL